MNERELTWRDVFDTEHKRWPHLSTAMEAALQAGYLYLCWNGRIYTINGKDTGLFTTDVR